MFIGPLVLVIVALLVLLIVPRSRRRITIEVCWRKHGDSLLLDWADKAGHHSVSYPSSRAELRALKALDERTNACL